MRLAHGLVSLAFKREPQNNLCGRPHYKHDTPSIHLSEIRSCGSRLGIVVQSSFCPLSPYSPSQAGLDMIKSYHCPSTHFNLPRTRINRMETFCLNGQTTLVGSFSIPLKDPLFDCLYPRLSPFGQFSKLTKLGGPLNFVLFCTSATFWHRTKKLSTPILLLLWGGQRRGDGRGYITFSTLLVKTVLLRNSTNFRCTHQHAKISMLGSHPVFKLVSQLMFHKSKLGFLFRCESMRLLLCLKLLIVLWYEVTRIFFKKVSLEIYNIH